MTKAYYNRNCKKIKETAKLWTIKQRKKLKDWIVTLKSNYPCSNCKGKFSWYVMTLGNNDIPKLVQKGVSVNTLREAVGKCELLCANCRRIDLVARGVLTDSRALS